MKYAAWTIGAAALGFVALIFTIRYGGSDLAFAAGGNLDPAKSLEIMLLLQKINELGTTVLVVTHEKELVNRIGQRVIAIDGGRIISDGMDRYYDYEA